MTSAAEQAADIERSVAGRTLLDALDAAASGHGDIAALKWRSGSQWQSLSWRELREQAGLAALGFRELGVGPGEVVGILMSNRPELVIADLALLYLRAVPVCLFDSFTDEQMATVLCDLGIQTVIAGGEAELRRLGGAVRIVLVADNVPVHVSWQSLIAAGRTRAALGDGTLEELRRAVRPDDMVSVNYTSGTTGGLKGVRHTHQNVLWHAESFGRFMPVPPGTRFLSYLSRAHATERFISTWYPLVRAATVHLCPGPLQLGEYLADVRPQFFGGVQRVWEKLYAARAAPPGLDEVRFAFSGGGALAKSVLEFFQSTGIPLAEGWGQSELVSAAACGRAGELRIGTAGRPLPGVSIRVAADGELLVRSGSQMLGYAGPNALAHPADADGWLHTGDLGRIDTDGYVHVDGRRQEVFRLASGHLVSASRVESQLRANHLVDHACVVGAGAEQLCAILVVGAPADRWTAADLEAIVRECNELLAPADRIARFEVLRQRWEPGGAEELTHTGKLNRKLVASKYSDLIAALVSLPCRPYENGGYQVRPQKQLPRTQIREEAVRILR